MRALMSNALKAKQENAFLNKQRVDNDKGSARSPSPDMVVHTKSSEALRKLKRDVLALKASQRRE